MALSPRRFLFLIRNPYDAWRSCAARAAKGWKWFHRWPDEPVTVSSFASHWRRLAANFIENHHRVNGLIVRYEDLSRGEHSGVDEYLGFPLDEEAGRVNPGDGGPAPLGELLASDRIVLENELGSLASSLGYETGSHADRPRSVPGVMTDIAIAAGEHHQEQRTDLCRGFSRTQGRPVLEQDPPAPTHV